MKVRCGKCKTVLEYQAEKLNQNNPLLKCPKCNTINKVELPASYQVNKNTPPVRKRVQEKSNDETLIEGGKNNNEEVGWIVVHDENTKVQSYPLRLGKNIIGRKSVSKPCDIMIETDDKYMSRNHCAIEVVKNKRGQYDYIIYEVSATNGTFINASIDKKLSRYDQIYLKDGNTIQIGHTKVVLKTKEMAMNISEAQNTVINTDYNKTIIIT